MQGHAWDAPSGHGAGDRVDDGEVSRTTEIRFDQFGSSQNQIAFSIKSTIGGLSETIGYNSRRGHMGQNAWLFI